jgi:hypothetical protein
MERCHREIAEIEGQLLGGHPDVEGLCLALSDWSSELRILRNEQRRQLRFRQRADRGRSVQIGAGWSK